MGTTFHKEYMFPNLKSSTKVTVYTKNNDFIEKENKFIYSNDNNLLTKQTATNSKGETLTTEYQYPQDLKNDNIAKRLIVENRISEPLKIVQKTNSNTVISSIYNEYNEFNGILQKSRVFQAKGKDYFNEDNVKITYNSYDSKGNITQYTLENGTSVSIIWGYNGQYPIARIEGVTLAEIPQWLIDYNVYPSNVGNDSSLTQRLNYLRNEPYFKNAKVTAYTYKPLVGVTRIIKPNGQTEHYKYDEANRLQEIKNDKGEVLKTIEYNYKN